MPFEMDSTISIHAPPRGGRHNGKMTPRDGSQFQSTPPVRGATPKPSAEPLIQQISIHAPREGGDPGLYRHCGAGHHFNPRPREGGDSTLTQEERWELISIHAPVRGATKIKIRFHTIQGFQSTPP